jgi:serine/threonine protein kinase
MEIVHSVECFKRVDNGRLQFNYVELILKRDSNLHIARTKDRQPSTASELYDVQPLSIQDRGPLMQPSWTTAELVDAYFVKRPKISDYKDPDLPQQIQREIEICEALRKTPHPNVALYLGCQTCHGRVSGICFKRYTSTLADKVNPKHLNKNKLINNRPTIDRAFAKTCTDGIKAGIDHIHSLGLVHNDITPSNIMLDHDGKPVIVDFGSCTEIGQPLGETKRTYGWFDPAGEIAMMKNDLDAWEELKAWLCGSSTDFRFPGG